MTFYEVKFSVTFKKVKNGLFLVVVYFLFLSVDVVFAGTFFVSISFPLIFLRCFACASVDHTDDMWGHLFYYAPFIAIFQFGWASTQIAHMALMSSLTQDKSQQTGLSGLRSVHIHCNLVT